MKRAAIIGLGDISPIHLGAIAANPQIELAAACDIDPAAAERAPEGATFYTSYEELAEHERIDCVHVCLPHYLHYPVSAFFARRGVNVFCEKPLAVSVDQAQQFAQLEADHPEVHIGICLQNRLNETVEMLKGIIDGGKYGAVLGARGVVPWYRPKLYYDVKPWRGHWAEAGSGCMMNQSIHTLDLLQYLGGPVVSLRATCSQLLGYGIEVEDTVTANLSYGNGARGLFFATNANFANESVEIAVRLEKATFRINDGRLYRLDDAGSPLEPLCEDRKLPGSKFYYGASHAKLIGAFYRSLEDGGDACVHVRDAVPSIRLIDAILRSDRERGTVEV